MDRRELNNNLFDEILKYAVEKKIDDMANNLPSKEYLDENVSFRPEFEKRMEQFFKRSKRRVRGIRIRKELIRGVVSIMVILVVSTAITFSVEALRVPFLNFFSNVNQQSTTIHVQDEKADYSAFSDQIEGLYLPTYIPDSYSVKAIDFEINSYIILFEDTNQNIITLQRVLEGSSVGVDSETADIESLTVNNEQAQYYEKNGVNTLVFKYEESAFMLYGTVSEDELVKIAESMKIR